MPSRRRASVPCGRALDGPPGGAPADYLTGYSAKRDYQKFLVAPLNLRAGLQALIEREIEHARRGEPAHLIFKLNHLVG